MREEKNRRLIPLTHAEDTEMNMVSSLTTGRKESTLKQLGKTVKKMKI